MRLAIIVTEEDIKLGREGINCPIEIAASRVAGTEISVGSTVMFTPGSRDRRRSNLPLFVQGWIRKFDDYEDVRPFGFEVELI